MPFCILLIDRDDVHTKKVSATLEEAGYEVTIGVNLIEAMRSDVNNGHQTFHAASNPA